MSLPEPYYQRGPVTIYHGNCLELLPLLPDGAVDSVVTDPPYAEIDRDYGRLTETEWFAMMTPVVESCRRIVGSNGSAVFVLQPNSERVGRMRPWLWKFMAQWTEEWNMPQDAWWWNFATPPTVHCHEVNGLMRPSVKACVWLGGENCYRDQRAVLLPVAEATSSDKRIGRHELGYSPSGLSMRHGRALSKCLERDGATPFNLLVCANSDAKSGGGALGHGAATPYPLAEWWVRYITRECGAVLDPFLGSGTTAVAAIRTGHQCVGIELEERYCEIAANRCDRELDQGRLPFDQPAAKPERQGTLFESGLDNSPSPEPKSPE